MNEHPYRSELEAMKNPDSAAFAAKLSPEQDADLVLGIKSLQLKDIAKAMVKEGKDQRFLQDLPHRYFEENLIHSILISRIKDFDEVIEKLEAFRPYMNDWAVTDTIRPKAFAKSTERLKPFLEEWLSSTEPYTVRCAIGFYMTYCLGEAFDFQEMEQIASLRFEHYYVRMMVAWYMATALFKQREAALTILREERLDVWTHNKAIQKAVESRRISEEDKAMLKMMKRRTE